MPTYIEAIQEVSVVKKPVGEEELEDNNKQVEKLTGDETTEVNVVPDNDINLDLEQKTLRANVMVSTNYFQKLFFLLVMNILDEE